MNMKAAEPNKVTEQQLRDMTLNLLIQWFDNEVYLGRDAYAEGANPRKQKSLDIPESRIREMDPLAEAKKARPWNWTTTTERKYVTYDHEGNEIELTETISILDAFGPGPRETPRQLRSKAPDGRKFIDSTAHISEREKDELRTNMDYMRRLHRAIQHLDHFAPTKMYCLNEFLRGKSTEAIANRLKKIAAELDLPDKVSVGTVNKYIDGAITWITGCIVENPIWREHEREFREVLRRDNAERAREQRFETIWG